MKSVNKILSLVLCLTMVLSVFAIVPFSAGAAETDVAETGASSGTTGDCTWTLDDDGLLTISGNGAMGNDEPTPWGTNISKVIIEDGVTSIGSLTFFECAELTSIDIPDSVTSIGWTAFADCTGLTNVTIGNSVTRIDDEAFSGCTGLTSIDIPDSVTSIGFWAFYNCTGLTNITIPDSVTSIGDKAIPSTTHICCSPSSEAETYAKKWGNSYGHDYVLTPIDAENHQGVCSYCGAKTEPEAHTFTDGLCACGYTESGIVEDAQLTDEYRSISLKSDLSINYYIPEEIIDQYTDPYIICKKAIYDESGNITGYDEQRVESDRSLEYEGKTYIGFNFSGISAKEFSSVVTSAFYGTKDGLLHEGKSSTYSIKEYAMTQLSQTTDTKLQRLLVDLLNYGTAAQTFFKTNTANPANADLSSDQKALADVTADMIDKPYDSSLTTLPMGVAFKSVTLSLKSETSLSLYFTSDKELFFSCNNDKDVEKETVSVGSTEYQVARIRGIKAKELGNDFTLTILDGTNSGSVTYSPMTYCYNVLNRGTTEENLPETVKALYWYRKSAKEYFEQ